MGWRGGGEGGYGILGWVRGWGMVGWERADGGRKGERRTDG